MKKDLRIPVEVKKEEALRRLKTLKLHPNVVKEFEKEGRLYYSETQLGTLYWMDNQKEYVQAIQEFEERTGHLVYFGILTHMEFGKCLSLLYVSDYQDDWRRETPDLEEGIVPVYVVNLNDDYCSEFGNIGFKPRFGGLIRTW